MGYSAGQITAFPLGHYPISDASARRMTATLGSGVPRGFLGVRCCVRSQAYFRQYGEQKR